MTPVGFGGPGPHSQNERVQSDTKYQVDKNIIDKLPDTGWNYRQGMQEAINNLGELLDKYAGKDPIVLSDKDRNAINDNLSFLRSVISNFESAFPDLKHGFENVTYQWQTMNDTDLMTMVDEAIKLFLPKAP